MTALRARANQVIDTELARLYARLPQADDATRREVADAVRRAVEKVLHAPTVRVKELASMPGGDQYANALRELFDLDPADGRIGRRGEEAHGGRRMTAVRTLRIGTRASALARVQTDLVVAALGAPVEIVPIVTEGDRSSAALDPDRRHRRVRLGVAQALLDGEIDVAVHSFKDLPTAAADGIVSPPSRPARIRATSWSPVMGSPSVSCPAGARVGTGSPRRAAQLRALGLGLEIVPIRGNVDTRLGKVAAGEVDAVVLALAGLRRLGRADEATEILDPIQVLPAPAQGALAMECRSSDDEARAVLRRARRPGHTRGCRCRACVARRPRGGLLGAGGRPCRDRRRRCRHRGFPSWFGDRGRRQ